MEPFLISIQEYTRHIVGQNSALEILMAFSALVLSFLAGKVIKLSVNNQLKKLQKTPNIEFLEIIWKEAYKRVVPLSIYIGILVFKTILHFPDTIQRIIDGLLFVMLSFFMGQIFQHIGVKIFQFLSKQLSNGDSTNQGLFNFFEKVLSFLVWVIVIFIIAGHFDIELSPLLASLGIGGLAFALAAKDTLGNFFASIAIFFDTPFKVGEMVKIGEFEGTVKEIGMRSTRIQSFGKREIIIPNSTVASETIENISRRPGIRFDFRLGLVYDTSVENMKKATKKVKEIINSHPDIVKKDTWVCFEGFGDFSLNIYARMIVKINKSEGYSKAIAVREEINFALMEEFEKNGFEFAYPTQVIYTKKEIE